MTIKAITIPSSSINSATGHHYKKKHLNTGLPYLLTFSSLNECHFLYPAPLKVYCTRANERPPTLMSPHAPLRRDEYELYSILAMRYFDETRGMTQCPYKPSHIDSIRREVQEMIPSAKRFWINNSSMDALNPGRDDRLDLNNSRSVHEHQNTTVVFS
nr:hypothetical protein Iba_chr13cCG0480 [Ipomoea batatas]